MADTCIGKELAEKVIDAASKDKRSSGEVIESVITSYDDLGSLFAYLFEMTDDGGEHAISVMDFLGSMLEKHIGEK